MVETSAAKFGLKVEKTNAIEWFRTRGSLSGRIACPFIRHIAGQQQKNL
jgi:predicted AAA+ superfamily ATPase